MPLELQEATYADALRIVEIARDAFAPDPFDKIFFPGPFPEDILDCRAVNVVEDWKRDPSVRFLKVVDTDIPGSDGLIACAKWLIYNPRPVLPPKPSGEEPPGMNAEACGVVFPALGAKREKNMGDRRYVNLQLLLTDPKHQRRGAGTMLVSWGLDEAVKLELPVYLHATPAGHPLYLKLGFVDIEEYRFDLSKWGAKIDLVGWAMIKEVTTQEL